MAETCKAGVVLDATVEKMKAMAEKTGARISVETE